MVQATHEATNVGDDNDVLARAYQEPLEPFGSKDTLLSCLRWPVALTQMGLWLGVFKALDLTVLPATKIDRLARLACWLGTRSVGIRVKTRGLEKLSLDQNYLFCINHVSLLDTPVLVQSIPVFTRAFQDAAQFRIPIYGSFVRMLGELPVDRQDRELNRRSHAQARALLRDGKSFAVFPEGHRTRDGRLGPFYPGAFRLALEAQVPVVPVCTRGLRNLCPAKEWRLRGGTVEVLFGAPIQTDDVGSGDCDELAARVHAAMQELLVHG